MANFGNTVSAGANPYALSVGELQGSSFSLGSALYGITDGYFYVDGNEGTAGTQVFKIACYSDSSGPNAPLAISSEYTVTHADAATWAHVTFTSFNLSAGTYWLVYNAGGTNNVGRYFRADSSSGHSFMYKAQGYTPTPFPNPFGTASSGSNIAICIYLVGSSTPPAVFVPRLMLSTVNAA